MSLSYLNDFVSTIKGQVQGFVSISVVITEFGNVIASEVSANNVSAEDSAVFQAEIYKQAIKSLDVTGASTNIKEITIVSDDRMFFINSAVNGKFLAILAVDAAKSNMGIAKTVLSKNLKGIEGNLSSDF